jgi:hypothetical protein
MVKVDYMSLKLSTIMHATMAHLVHPSSILRRAAGKLLSSVGLKDSATIVYRKWFKERGYQRWIRTVEPMQINQLESDGLLISVIVPCHKYVGRYFVEMLESVQAQTYKNWELVVVNACDNAEDARSISEAIKNDARILEVRLEKNLHISANTNAGVAAAHGSYLALLDYDDILAPSALAAVASTIAVQPQIDALYSDEDKLSDRGELRYYPFFKPEFNEEQFLTSNFVTHFTVIRTSLMRKLGGLRVGLEGSQDYDLWLRLYEKTSNISHVAQMSYHWRIAEGSTAGVVSSKSYASAAGKKALEEHLERRRIRATVTDFPGQSSTYQVHFAPPGHVKLLVVTTDGSLSDDLDTELKPFTHDRIYASEWQSEAYIGHGYTHVLFAVPHLSTVSPGWLRELIGKSSQPGVGVVSAGISDVHHLTLLGYALRDDSLAPIYGDHREDLFNYDGLNTVPRPLLVVPSLCAVVSSDALKAVALRDASALSDWVEWCLNLQRSGHRNVAWTLAKVEIGSAHSLQDLSVPAGEHHLPTDPYLNPRLRISAGKAVL